MTPWILVPAGALIGYLLGSIPVGLWVCRLYGVDIRTVGSGRTGGTNAWRAAGLKAAIPTILGDAIKGAVAVWVIRWLFYRLFPEPAVMSVDEAVLRTTAVQLAAALAGGMAVIGHNWSVFNGFQGGAGGITSAATAMAISPLVGSVVWLVGGILIWWTRIASVGTFAVGAGAFALFLILGVNRLSPWPYIVFGVIAFFSVLMALRSNREKLRNQEERIITLW
ncbi:MAG: glycerol-3-phosphate acyltransferase [Caldilineaceae bacterium]|nr:glycerol-3-phosphate acyltransferase [Caldilineaceae bacterium]